MPKLSELVPIMSSVLGVPQNTLGVIARHARAAGAISSSGRGPGGAEMSASDCTNLLIAAMRCHIGGQAKDAGKIISEYRSATWNGIMSGTVEPAFSEPLPDCFGDAIDYLIQTVTPDESGDINFIRVTINTIVGGSIKVGTNKGVDKYNFSLMTKIDDPEGDIWIPTGLTSSDLNAVTDITQRTIRTLSAFLRGNP